MEYSHGPDPRARAQVQNPRGIIANWCQMQLIPKDEVELCVLKIIPVLLSFVDRQAVLIMTVGRIGSAILLDAASNLRSNAGSVRCVYRLGKSLV